jgi:hypothetical protein
MSVPRAAIPAADVYPVVVDRARVGATLPIGVSAEDLNLLPADMNFHHGQNPLAGRVYPVGIEQGALAAPDPGASPFILLVLLPDLTKGV